MLTSYLTLEPPIINTKLFLQNQWKSFVFKKYLIIEYLYIYWFIIFSQKQFHVMYYIFAVINPSATMIPKGELAHL